LDLDRGRGAEKEKSRKPHGGRDTLYAKRGEEKKSPQSTEIKDGPMLHCEEGGSKSPVNKAENQERQKASIVAGGEQSPVCTENANGLLR